jgi:hypothetical protein
MRFIGQGLAFCSLVIVATVLELHDKEADGLWLLVVVWVIFGTWTHSKKCECKDETE